MDEIEHLQRQIAKLQEEVIAKRNAARKAQDEAWDALRKNPDNWEWRVKPDQRHGKQGLYVAKRLKQELLREFLKNGPTSINTDLQEPERWFGMFYYRTEENILARGGGGWLVLRDPKLCSDEEWAAIAAGNIPKKFIRDDDEDRWC